jgi:hypothetical protein
MMKIFSAEWILSINVGAIIGEVVFNFAIDCRNKDYKVVKAAMAWKSLKENYGLTSSPS